MTMINTPSGSGTALASTPFWGLNRSRISWGAVLAGAIVSVATTLLLSLLGAALGAGSIHALDATRTDLSNYGTGAAIWEIINLALSMAFGGYVASRLSGTHSHLDGELHGVTMWAVAVLLGSVLLAQAVSGLAGLVGSGLGSVGSGLGSAVSQAVGGPGAASSAVPSEINPQAVIDRLQQSLGSSGDPTTMSREQISAEIGTLVRRGLPNGNLSDSDRNRLVDLVAAQSGVTREEAARRVTRMETDAKTSLAQVEQKARVAADEVARSAATAARALFTALVVGLLSALIGAWLGTRHKRVLHPVVEHAHAGHEPVYGTHSYERAAPSSVSVYDDTGHVVLQYLRGVTFPLNKQDLLRLARSRNAGSSLLHSIERMADGNYANTDEVLRALGSAH
ncbi:MAG: DUF2795 domain-containing protein [Bradyrhizobium sp.]|nr:DUF2795 domain-containing protein [Bradyrhizobium sp.]